MKIAVIAPMYNEETLLPHFIRHYSSFADKIVLLDNESTDASVGIARTHKNVEVRSFRTEGYSEEDVLRLLTSVKSELSSFEWHLFPGIDEFIVTFPPRKEREILEAAQADVYVCHGFCLVETKEDAPFDTAFPISGQRSHGYKDRLYSKPVVIRASSAVVFGPGKHAILPGKGVRMDWESPFHLIHADGVDFDLFRYRKNRRELSKRNIEMGWAVGYFRKSEEQHRALWKSWQARATEVVQIPDWGELYS